jgi:hypothetical protein
MNLKTLGSAMIAATALAFGTSLFAQAPAPDIAFDSNPDLLKFPDNIHLGEAAGVATNSKGHVSYTRTGAANAALGTSRTFYKAGSRLFSSTRPASSCARSAWCTV